MSPHVVVDDVLSSTSSVSNARRTYRDRSQHKDQKKGMPSAAAGVHAAPIVEIHSPEELEAFLKQDDRICVIK
jgi:hypothetical protein